MTPLEFAEGRMMSEVHSTGDIGIESTVEGLKVTSVGQRTGCLWRLG